VPYVVGIRSLSAERTWSVASALPLTLRGADRHRRNYHSVGSSGTRWTTIGDAYQILVDMTVALTFILSPCLRRYRSCAQEALRRSGLLRVPGGWVGVALVTCLGVSSTLLSIGFALIPPAGGNAETFYLKVLGGCALFLGSGLVLYFNGRRRSAADLAPGIADRDGVYDRGA
jgi:hypothetical protein